MDRERILRLPLDRYDGATSGAEDRNSGSPHTYAADRSTDQVDHTPCNVLDSRADPLDPPHAVMQAVAEYRSEQNIIGCFIEERCIRDPQSTIRSRELYTAFRGWEEEAGERPISEKKFGTKLSDMGFATVRNGQGNLRVGLGLV